MQVAVVSIVPYQGIKECRMYKSHVLIAITLLVLLLVGCAPQATPVATPTPLPVSPESPASQPSASVAPQASDWEQVVEAAKKEGQVNF